MTSLIQVRDHALVLIELTHAFDDEHLLGGTETALIQRVLRRGYAIVELVYVQIELRQTLIDLAVIRKLTRFLEDGNCLVRLLGPSSSLSL